MSKIYDALEHAQQELKEKEKPREEPKEKLQEKAPVISQEKAQEKIQEAKPSPPPKESAVHPTIATPPETKITPSPSAKKHTKAELKEPTIPDELELEGEMISLYQTIDSLLSNIPNRVVLFVGSLSGEGTSTVARELSKVVAMKLGKTVLLVDLDRSRPDFKIFKNIKVDCDLEEVIKGNIPIDNAFCQVEDSSLYLSPLFQKSMLDPHTLDSAKSNVFWSQLRKRFDLIFIDTPPATLFSDSFSLARQADGVILVVEAEKTSWPIALSVKEKIIKHGGNVLGIVFNRRRFYIPQFIYKRL